MKHFKYLFAICLAMLSLPVMTSAQSKNEKEKVLRHVVLFKFKEGTSAADISRIEAAFRALPSKIKEIKSFEWGLNNSPENLNQGFTHCFFLSFNSEKDRAIYLPHPAHKAFGDQLGDRVEKVLVLDYWAEN
jgi:hypothetical protein